MADPKPSTSESAPNPNPQGPPPDVTARIKEAYDSIAPAYNTWTQPHNAPRLDYTNKLVQLLGEHHSTERASSPSLANKKKKALELGCGAGVPVLEILLAQGMDVIGVDLSAAQIALAAGHFQAEIEQRRIELVEQDMMKLAYDAGELDAVVALYSIAHLPRDDQRIMLERVERWLKPGGMILMNFPVEELEGEVIEKWLGEDKGWMYWSAWGEAKTMEMIKGLGFEVLVQEVKPDLLDVAHFLWVIARKPGPPHESAKETE